MKRLNLLILIIGVAILFFGCSKNNPMAPDVSQSDELTNSFKAKKTTTDFTGTSSPRVPLGTEPNVWYDDASDPRVTGITIWVTDVGSIPEGKLCGTAELFVGADEIGDDYDGKWEMKWYGTVTPPMLVAHVVGIGTEGNVKGMFTQSTYTMDLGVGPPYVTAGYIAPKQLTKTLKTIKASGPFALYPPGHPSNNCDEGICKVYVSGSGNCSHLGKFTVENFGCFDVFGGTGQVGDWFGFLTAANGDMINTQLIYSWEADGLDWYFYDIIGGDGRFDGASGYIENYGNTDYFNPLNPFEGGIWDLEGEGVIVY